MKHFPADRGSGFSIGPTADPGQDGVLRASGTRHLLSQKPGSYAEELEREGLCLPGHSGPLLGNAEGESFSLRLNFKYS